MFVLTVDQRSSRRGPDRVADVLDRLNASTAAVLRFERTAGDEFQGVLLEAGAVVDVVLDLARLQGWSIGVGAGPVDTPLPDSTRAASGTAFLCARRAVDAAKQRPVRVAVRGRSEADAADAQAVLTALVALVQRRSAQAWEAIDVVAQGHTQTEAAARLGITRQAVGQRLAAAQWDLEGELRPTAARLLLRAEGPPTAAGVAR
ncbi:hypothetical protein GB931_03490 [Modestobacter sp. I12A-02628]|uniref:SatD family protein n=1 Tax=Goekera deserti TaxID=2497753 RepID=A0A7K3WFI6_9ACTN|nr:hypothetical protein [Goekera deserti]NDI46684.1 hypothetical protein [Goekera deserti]NEL54253.1 hypothetical protein [Goekera deserti]